MKHVTIYLDEALWHAFRMACLSHNIPASQEIAAFIRAKLQYWATQQGEHPENE